MIVYVVTTFNIWDGTKLNGIFDDEETARNFAMRLDKDNKSSAINIISLNKEDDNGVFI